MKDRKRLKLAAIGCGGRTLTYLSLAAKMPDKFEIIAVADILPNRVEDISKISNNPDLKKFYSDTEILSQPKLADIMIIGTQDAYHFIPAKKALEKGYDLLLEKPISPNPSEILELERIATSLKRRVLICHVLRYTAFYKKVKELVSSGAIGKIMTLNAIEGVGDWHQCHSFVRGHWAVTQKSSPMILAKCCHDMDIIHWLLEEPCISIASSGSLSFFNSKNAPEGSPPRCTDGCPVSNSCPYNALLYLNKHRAWLSYVFDKERENLDKGGASEKDIIDWLKESPWGRCVWHCDNTAVDHQTLDMLFENEKTATFTMTAFSSGRDIEIYGTKGILRGGEFVKRTTGADIIIIHQDTGNEERFYVNPDVGGYSGHGGGDAGLMFNLYSEMTEKEPSEMSSSIQKSIESHMMAFAAEEARITGKRITIKEIKEKYSK